MGRTPVNFTEVEDRGPELKRKRQLARYIAIGLLNWSELSGILRELRQFYHCVSASEEIMLLDKMIDMLWLSAERWSSEDYPLKANLRREALEKGLLEP